MDPTAFILKSGCSTEIYVIRSLHGNRERHLMIQPCLAMRGSRDCVLPGNNDLTSLLYSFEEQQTHAPTLKIMARSRPHRLQSRKPALCVGFNDCPRTPMRVGKLDPFRLRRKHRRNRFKTNRHPVHRLRYVRRKTPYTSAQNTLHTSWHVSIQFGI